MKHTFIAICLSLSFIVPVHAQERCALRYDVPEEIRFPGILVLVLVEPQCFAIYEDGQLSTRILGRSLYGYASTGMRGHRTPFSDPIRGPNRITRAHRHYWSKTYSVFWRGREVPAYMPYSLFFTNDGHALHEGRVDRMFASHGCVRLPTRAAEALFGGFPHDEVQVVITRNKASFRAEWEGW